MYKHFQPKLHVCPLVCKSLKLEKKKINKRCLYRFKKNILSSRGCVMFGVVFI